MNTYADKRQKTKNQSIANTFSIKQKHAESTFQFVDNRPEAAAQRMLQEIANNSQRAKRSTQLQSALYSNTVQQQPIQMVLDDDQRAAVHKNFYSAYDTATFRRMSFSNQDRLSAWIQQANAEARFSGESLDEDAANVAIEEMGLTAEGIHLRHVIPYSDIAGVLRVATSDSTTTFAGGDYSRAIRSQVTKLTALIGSEETQRLWAASSSSEGLLKTGKGREIIRGIYRDLAHSQKNLFHGSGSANMAIRNRPDASVFATGILGEEQVRNLLDWWYETMTILELTPQFSSKEIFDIHSGSTVDVGIYSHHLSRPLGALQGGSDELEMIERKS